MATLLCILACLIAPASTTVSVTSLSRAPVRDGDERRAEIEQLLDQFQPAYQVWLAPPQHTWTRERRREHAKEHPASQYVERLTWLAARLPSRSDHVFLVQAFVARHLQHTEWLEDSLDALLKGFRDDPRLAEVVSRLWPYEFDRDITRSFLEDIAKRSKDREVRANALYKLAISLTGEVLAGRLPRATSTERRAYRKAREEALDLGREYDSKYADVVIRGRKRRLADYAVHLEQLAPGMEAPEIKGEDLAGNPFTLREYRGKVVLLTFWGDW